jgi:hypothetical protein
MLLKNKNKSMKVFTLKNTDTFPKEYRIYLLSICNGQGIVPNTRGKTIKGKICYKGVGNPND